MLGVGDLAVILLFSLFLSHLWPFSKRKWINAFTWPHENWVKKCACTRTEWENFHFGLSIHLILALIMAVSGVHEGPTCHSSSESYGECRAEVLRFSVLIRGSRNRAVCEPSASPQWQVNLCSPGGWRDGFHLLNYSSFLHYSHVKRLWVWRTKFSGYFKVKCELHKYLICLLIFKGLVYL